MVKHTIYGIVLFSVIFLGCVTPEDKQQNAEQMVIEGVFYLDDLPISVVVEDGLIKKYQDLRKAKMCRSITWRPG